MHIKTDEDREGMERIGRLIGRALRRASRLAKPGASTGEIDQAIAAFLADHGAESSPQKHYNFPACSCISVNDEVVHGIPGKRKLQPGDLVKIDLEAECEGYIGDSCVTVGVGQIPRQARLLKEAAEAALGRAIALCRPGLVIREIGALVQRDIEAAGFSVVPQLCGHGVGRACHEEPSIPQYDDPRATGTLTEGLVFTIEPIIVAGEPNIQTAKDKWTIRTIDRSIAAHAEHTVVVEAEGARILTLGDA